jgi:hypothetical protein
MGKFFAAIAAEWNSLPHPVQAVVMLFVGAGTGVLRRSLEQQPACFSGTCLKGDIISAIHAGALAVVALYIPSSLGKN